MNRTWSALDASLDELVGPGGFARGAQVCVLLGGRRVLDRAFGHTLDGELHVEHLHSVFCLTKPLAALAVARLIDAGFVDLDRPVEDVVGRLAFVPPETTLASVLNHSAGLAKPPAIEWRICPPHERAGLLARTQNEPGAVYSEIAGGLVVDAVIERCTGLRADRWVTEEILAPAGLVDDFIICPELAASDAVRSRVRVAFGGPRQLPLLSERLTAQLRECSLAFGAIATARGIAGIFDLWRRALCGGPSPCSRAVATALVRRRRGAAEDPVILRRGDFACGVAVGLAEHDLGHLPSPQAIGHAAGMSVGAGIADPETDVALGVYLNGSTHDDLEAACRARTSIIDAIFADLQPCR